MNVKTAYVAGAFRAPTYEERQRNLMRAITVAVWGWDYGYAVICPHLNGGALCDYVKEDTVLMPGHVALAMAANMLILVPGWQESGGATVEFVAWCRSHSEDPIERNEAFYYDFFEARMRAEHLPDISNPFLPSDLAR